MKNSYFLSLVIGFSMIGSLRASQSGTVEYKEPTIQEVMAKKTAQYKETKRETYQILDPLVSNISKVDWPVVFSILDSMRGVINVNEYRTFDKKEQTLLAKAVEENNLSAVQKLLKVYGANPNIISQSPKASGTLMTPLMSACLFDYTPVVKLLLEYGGNPSLTTSRGHDCFFIAKDNPEILRLLNQYKK